MRSAVYGWSLAVTKARQLSKEEIKKKMKENEKNYFKLIFLNC